MTAPPRAATAAPRATEVDALRVEGRIREALALLRRPPESVTLVASVGPEVLLDAGAPDAARAMLVRGRLAARAAGSRHHLALAETVEAKIALRIDRDPESAGAALDRARRIAGDDAEVARRIATCQSLALLLEGRDEPARHAASCSLCAYEARKEQPTGVETGAVYLAEASWRLGDEAGADAAADLALAAAERQGSNHLLLQALADFPAVLYRRLDSEPTPDTPWHALGRTLSHVDGPKTRLCLEFSAHQGGASVRLGEFGGGAVFVGGVRVRPRIAKAVELLALLAARGPISRDEALAALFGARGDDSARAYLRQAVGQLRKVLPGEETVRVDGDRLALADEATIVTDSGEVEGRVAEALRLRGRAKVDALLAAIAPAEVGLYLAGVDSLWVVQRREALARLISLARFEAADAALGIVHLEEARWLNRRSLAVDPLREAAWRQRMRIEAALRDRAGVEAAWRECVDALATIGASPAPSTAALRAGFVPFPLPRPVSVG